INNVGTILGIGASFDHLPFDDPPDSTFILSGNVVSPVMPEGLSDRDFAPRATGLNDSNTVCGSTNLHFYYAVTWKDRVQTFLADGSASAINDAGDVVGMAASGPRLDFPVNGALWQAGGQRTIIGPAIGFDEADPTALNSIRYV